MEMLRTRRMFGMLALTSLNQSIRFRSFNRTVILQRFVCRLKFEFVYRGQAECVPTADEVRSNVYMRISLLQHIIKY